MFVIEDEIHAEPQGEFQSYEQALDELKKRSQIPFNVKPNQCPCTNWENCERQYHIIEYDTRKTPWEKLNDKLILKMSKNKTEWSIK